jgi:hypothetical protein
MKLRVVPMVCTDVFNDYQGRPVYELQEKFLWWWESVALYKTQEEAIKAAEHLKQPVVELTNDK